MFKKGCCIKQLSLDLKKEFEQLVHIYKEIDFESMNSIMKKYCKVQTSAEINRNSFSRFYLSCNITRNIINFYFYLTL